MGHFAIIDTNTDFVAYNKTFNNFELYTFGYVRLVITVLIAS